MTATLDCPTGKLRYPSPQNAWRTIRALQSRKRRITEGGAYQCPRCQGYHVTHARETVVSTRPWELAP